MSGSRYKNVVDIQAESPLFGQGVAAVPKGARVENLYPNTPLSTLGLLARTCQKVEAETGFFRLMTAVIGAEPESYSQENETNLAAIAILKRHPELLFVKGMVVDHSGRKIFGSPYQLLLGAGDVWALKKVHEEIIPKIDGGAEKAQEQFQQQFPNCKLPLDAEMGEVALYDDRNIALVEQIKVTLKNVVAAITADPCTNGLVALDAISAAIEQLRQLFAPKEGEIIRTGLHFPIAILQEVFRVYDVQFGPWSGAQLAFFSREVIGAALAASTVVDGQSYKLGLSTMNVEKGPDRRDGLFCRHPKGIPAELAPLNNKLGRTMFVDPYDGQSCFLSDSLPGCFDCFNKNGWTAWAGGGMPPKVPVRDPFCAGGRGAEFGKLMSSKKSELTKLICPHPKPRPETTPSWCVIC